jgi:hypothetical protein
MGDQIKKNEMDGPYSMYGEKRGAYRVLVRKPKGKRQLGKPRHRLENNIEMYLQEVGWGVWTGFIWLGTETGDRQL